VDTSRTDPFERCALACGLLTKEQLDEARESLRASGGWPPDVPLQATGEQLAEKLVQLGKLNVWQAKQLLAGRTKFNLGPYLIVDSIGRGGMGQVFKAEHSVLGRVVAIKVLPRHKSTPEAIANFMQEIRAQARLDHPNLVRALDAGEDGSVYYLVTEYVPGTDLRKLVRRNGPLRMSAAASIISQAAAGLQHAHEQGLIHRDVKPGNVLVTPEGRAKLSDLGLAGPLGGDAESDPRFGKIVGTADYLSPDHIMAPWSPTPAWDIYSLGCTLYYAVTGKVPFPGGTTRDKARNHCELQPLDPRRLNAELSAAFVEVMADMMAKDPAVRIATAAQVIARLAPWTGEPKPLGDEAWLEQSVYAARVVAPRAGAGGAAEEGAGTEETEPSFPEFVEGPRRATDSSGQLSQGTDPLSSAQQETPRFWPRAPGEVLPAGALLRPLMFFVALPLALVGLVVLLWLLTRLLW